MSDLSAVTYIHLVEAVEEPRTYPAGEAVTQGQVVSINSSGKVVKARATTGPVLPKGIALTTAGAANLPVAVLRDGIVDVGNILSGLAYGALLYASDTAGVIADGSVNSLAAIGDVTPSFGGGATADKLLRIKMDAR
jgi:hypothetical protein